MLSNINDFMSSVIINIYNIRGINTYVHMRLQYMNVLYISNKISLDFSYTQNSIKLFQKLRMYNWRKKLQSLEISTSTTYVT